LTTAYHYNTNVQGKLGEVGLYAGDYAGQIHRLFDPAETDDEGTAISGYVEQGYLSYGIPETEKEFRDARLFGRTLASEVTLTVTGLLLRQANALGGAFNQNSNSKVLEFSAIAGLNEPGIDYAQPDGSVFGNVLNYKVEFAAWTEILAIEVGIDAERDLPPMG
jgi:hypothetical protein